VLDHFLGFAKGVVMQHDDEARVQLPARYCVSSFARPRSSARNARATSRISTVALLSVPRLRPPLFGSPFGRPPWFLPGICFRNLQLRSLRQQCRDPGASLIRGQLHMGHRFHQEDEDMVDSFTE
jgi:hypothetical protein